MTSTVDYGANEAAYGPLVDSYAIKYGVPTEYFRDAIGKLSGFDPNFQSATGSGIANLSVDPKSSVNSSIPSSITSSLDVVGQSLAGEYQDAGDWDTALKNFLGSSTYSPLSDDDKAVNAAGAAADAAASSKYIWQYDADDFKAIFKKYGIGALFVIGGVVLILGSVWVVVKSEVN